MQLLLSIDLNHGRCCELIFFYRNMIFLQSGTKNNFSLYFVHSAST